jgi:undecaprenyl-phosphate galactose phosphotransferase
VALPLRYLVRRALTRLGWWQVPVVVVGSGAAAARASAALQSESGLGYTVQAVVNAVSPGARRDAAGWSRVLHQVQAEMLVIAGDVEDASSREIAEEVARAGLPFALMPVLDDLPAVGYEATSFHGHDTVLLMHRGSRAKPTMRSLKVAFDLCAAVAALVALAPLMLLVAAAVRLDGGPALYAHTRIGVGGRPFPCFKFRSMCVDSDAVLQRLLETDPAAAEEWAATQKLRRDPRVTWIGAILRTTSLDELPQLLNVLRLEMSLVGPRPIVSREIPRYADAIAYYYETRPGLTGLWQVSGRTDTTYAQRVQLDSWYVKNWTMWHDLVIIAKTIPAVLKRRGAI